MSLWIGCGFFRDGHNGPNTTTPLIDYINSIAVVPRVGLFRAVKSGLLKACNRLIAPPRDLAYRLSRTGVNANKSVVKPADKATWGCNVIALINGINGATLAARAATGSS